ncbi:MAG: amidohydrolase family protein [Halobacteriovoraceae bacterium]|nr:amidohydrolase family protein [Halobacteriovoraceae bacterium]
MVQNNLKGFKCSLINPIDDLHANYIHKGVIIVIGENIAFAGEESEAPIELLQNNIEWHDFSNLLALPGFIDLHFHWVQDEVRSKDKASLISWLKKFTWPEEGKFEKETFSSLQAKIFAKYLASCGTIAGGCYSSLHRHTVDHAFENFKGHFKIGHVLMTMNSPEYLKHSDSEAVEMVSEYIKKYGDSYVVTPRFAMTVEPDVMKRTALMAKESFCYMQTHLCETKDEIDITLGIFHSFPGFEDVKNYTEIYDRCNMLGNQSIFGHCIYLTDEEFLLLAKSGSKIAHCPTSNAPVEDLGLGSGLFDIEKANHFGVEWGLGSDIGGGPYLSMFDVMESFVTQHQKAGRDSVNYTKALYRSTLKNAEILGLDSILGSFEKGKEASFIFVENSVHSSEEAEKVLKDLISPLSKRRKKMDKLVRKTYFKGNCIFE